MDLDPTSPLRLLWLKFDNISPSSVPASDVEWRPGNLQHQVGTNAAGAGTCGGPVPAAPARKTQLLSVHTEEQGGPVPVAYQGPWSRAVALWSYAEPITSFTTG